MTDRESNNYVGFKVNNGTFGWMGASTYWSNSTVHPVSAKTGLFGVIMGNNPYKGGNNAATGMGVNDTTFRPVIWN